jgi:hypothetical protein
VFSQPDIRPLFEPYLFVQLYTDRVPDEFYAPAVRAKFRGSLDRQIDDAVLGNQGFLEKVFETIELPLYVIIEPRVDDDRIDVIAFYQGLITNTTAFADFLRQSQPETAVALAR